MARKPRFLHDDEEIVLSRRPHIKTLFFVALILVAAIGGGIAATFLLNPSAKNRNDWITWAALIVGGLAALNFFRAWLSWRSDSLILTSQRLISRSGFIAKKSMEIPLDRINNISCSQSVGERLTGSGDLVIESGGEDGRAVFGNMSRPADIQREVYRQIERNQSRDLDRMGGGRALSIPEQIEKLDELRQRGVVSQSEFDAKKTQLLSQM
jgi:uncharacterized membrane protein YdbT with pleckstrin-like domain